MSFSLEHLDDRARPTAARPLGPDDVNWYPLVRAAFLAALAAFLVKLVALGFFAARAGIELEIQFWRGVVPHLSMQTPPAEFARIVTGSTLVMAVVATAAFTLQVLRSDADRMVVWGWFMGVFVAFETLLLELLRHALEPPVVTTTTVWRTAIPLTAGAAVAVAYSLILRERTEGPSAASPRSVVATADGSRAVDTRPAARRSELPPPAVTAASDRVFAEPAPASPATRTPSAPLTPVGDPVPVGGPVEDTPPTPRVAPTAVPVDSPLAATLAAASVPNRVVDARPNAASPDPLDRPAPAQLARRPAADIGPAPIVDARAHGPSDDAGPDSLLEGASSPTHGSNGP